MFNESFIQVLASTAPTIKWVAVKVCNPIYLDSSADFKKFTLYFSFVNLSKHLTPFFEKVIIYR